MRHCIRGVTAFVAIALLAVFVQPAGSQTPKADNEAMALATKITEEGAATFDKLDAKAMAACYVEDAEIALVTKDETALKVQNYIGRDKIEDFYADLFKKPETIKSRNTVEYAKLLAPDVLVIAGTFDTNTLKADSPKIPFYQTRVKQGDKWLMSSLRIYFLPKKP
jgi:ketosteroid isomerase-like protein